MIVVIVLAAMVVMALAAIAGTGRLGQWVEPVTDAPKGHLPSGPIGPAFFADLRIPTAPHGYARGEVDALLEGLAQGASLTDPPEFSVVRRGYDMAFVDAVVERCSEPRACPESPAAGQTGRMADEHEEK